MIVFIEAGAQEEKKQSPEERRKWTDRRPDTLLNALAEAQLTSSTLGNKSIIIVHADYYKSILTYTVFIL